MTLKMAAVWVRSSQVFVNAVEVVNAVDINKSVITQQHHHHAK